MIKRSERAKYAKHVFYAKFNDIDIFVEDTSKESKKIYCELLGRAIGGNVSINQVFSLGPKLTVIKRCELDQGIRERKAIYIIDGDYDIALGVAMPKLKRLYRLSRYSIENFLCDQLAFIEIISDESTSQDSGQISSLFDFSGWADFAVPSLLELILPCVAARVKGCGLPSVRISLSSIQGKEKDHICTLKVENLRNKYEVTIDSKYGYGTYSNVKSRIQEKFCSNSSADVFRFLPAKNILLPPLIYRAKRKNGLKIDESLLKCKLARRCDVTEMSDLSSFAC